MIKVNGVEILTVTDSLSWQGSKDEVARTLEFSFIYSATDSNFEKYIVKVGDKVEYVDDNTTHFIGYVESTDYTTDDNIVNVTCIDLMIRLLRSKCVGRFSGTLVELANNICGLFGLQNGITSTSTQKHNIVSEGDMSYYDILNTACHSVYDRYCLYLDGTTLKVASHSIIDTFEIKKNIRSSNFNSSMTNMVNKVIMINNEGQIVGAVQNADNISKYGLFQEVYNYNKDVKDNKAEAEKILKGLENKASIVCDNNNNVISGSFIKIYEPVNNFTGTFEVINDRHNITGFDDSMTLEVEYVTE